MAFCIQCGHRNPDEGRFCEQCGNPLVWGAHEAPRPKTMLPHTLICPACKKSSKSEKFCTNCGHQFVATSMPVPEPVVAATAVPPAVELPENTSSQEAERQGSGLRDGQKPKSRLALGVGIVAVLVVLGVATYMIMIRSNSEPVTPPTLSVDSPPTVPPVESERAPEPQPTPPLAIESSPPAVSAGTPVQPPQVAPTAEPVEPRAAPVRPKPARPKPVPPVKERPAPPPPPPAPPIAEKPVRQVVQSQFSCGDLPFGLLIACGLEGKDVIRKCAPDLKTWNHDIPGCKRQDGATNN